MDLYRSLLCVMASLVFCGCGGSSKDLKLAPVTGIVTFKGEPLASATVNMLSEKGVMSTGFTDNAGKFKLTTGGRAGAPGGMSKVSVAKQTAAAEGAVEVKTMKPEDMRAMQTAGGGVAKDLSPKDAIPKKYADPEKSGLTATVDPDGSKNVFEFPLVE